MQGIIQIKGWDKIDAISDISQSMYTFESNDTGLEPIKFSQFIPQAGRSLVSISYGSIKSLRAAEREWRALSRRTSFAGGFFTFVLLGILCERKFRGISEIPASQ